MKWLPTLLALLLPAALVQGGGAPRGDTVEFHSRLGLRLRKTFEQESHQELVDSSNQVSINGEEQETGDEDFELSIDIESRIVLLDETQEPGEGRPAKLLRTFETLKEVTKSEFSGGDYETPEEEVAESELEGKRVRFVWDEGDEVYHASFPEDESGDEDLLAELEGDVELLGLLPGKEVSPGDEWEIDLAHWRAIENPSGNLHLRVPDEEPEAEDAEKLYYDNLKGTISARYEGSSEENGRKLGRISLRGELESSVSQSEKPEGDFDGELEQQSRFDVDVTGELHWDLGAGHAASLRVESKLRVKMVLEQHVRYDDVDFSGHFEQSFEGTNVLEASFERVE